MRTNRFTLWVATLFVILTVIVIIIFGIGRSRPVADRSAILHLTECAPPCWIGITPGKTMLDEAEQRVKAVYGAPLNFTHNPANNHEEAAFSGQANPVQTISFVKDVSNIVVEIKVDLDIETNPVKSFDLVQALGTPDEAYVVRPNALWVNSALYYRHGNGGLEVYVPSTARGDGHDSPIRTLHYTRQFPIQDSIYGHTGGWCSFVRAFYFGMQQVDQIYNCGH